MRINVKTNSKTKHNVAIVIAVGGALPNKPDKVGETKTSGVKIRGCGAATKGTTARGPMA